MIKFLSGLVLHPYLKIIMFCAFSQNCEHFFVVENMHLKANCPSNLKNYIKILVGQMILKGAVDKYMNQTDK